MTSDGRRRVPEAPFQLVTIGEVMSAVRSRWLHREAPDVRLVAALAPELVSDRMHEDPIQPRVELFDVAQLGQLPPASDERFLDGVLGKVVIAQDQPRDRIEAVHLARGELAECLAVAAPRLFDEVLPHRGHLDSGRSPDRLLTL